MRVSLVTLFGERALTAIERAKRETDSPNNETVLCMIVKDLLGEVEDLKEKVSALRSDRLKGKT